jgi:hypothetical protein
MELKEISDLICLSRSPQIPAPYPLTQLSHDMFNQSVLKFCPLSFKAPSAALLQAHIALATASQGHPLTRYFRVYLPRHVVPFAKFLGHPAAFPPDLLPDSLHGRRGQAFLQLPRFSEHEAAKAPVDGMGLLK